MHMRCLFQVIPWPQAERIGVSIHQNTARPRKDRIVDRGNILIERGLTDIERRLQSLQ